MAGIGGAATAAQLALANPPATFPDGLDWFMTGSNIALLATAIFSGLGAVSAIYTFFQPAPYTKEQGDKDRNHGNASFKKLDERNDDRKDEIIEAIARDKHEQALKDIIDGSASGELKARYRKALGIERANGTRVTQREAAEFAIEAETASLSDDPRIREIAELIGQGKIIEASDRKAQIAEETIATAARELHGAARLALPVSPSKAMDHFKRATDLDPENIWSWIELGRLRAQYDGLDSAELCFGNALQRVRNERDRMVLHGEFGDLLFARGALLKAREEYEAALGIAKSLNDNEPGNAGWQRDLWVSHVKLGQLAEREGDAALTLKHLREAERVVAALAEKWPDHPGFANDLATVRSSISDIENPRGDG